MGTSGGTADLLREPVPSPVSARLRRAARRLGPWVVWLGAGAAAVYLHTQRSGARDLVGYGQRRSAVLTASDDRRVRSLLTELHQPVRKHQILLLLDDTEERQQLAVVSAELVQLRGQVDAARAELEMDQARSELTRRDLERQLLVDRAEGHIAYLEQLAENAALRARLQGAQLEFQVVAELDESGNASRIEVNRLETLVEELHGQLAGNESAARRMQSGFLEADRRWQEYCESAPAQWNYEPVLTPIKLEVEVKERELEILAQRIEQLTLRSPFDGQVTELAAVAGGVYPSGERLAVVTAGDTDRLVAYIPESQLPGPASGSTVRVRRPSSGTWFTGTVVSLADEISGYPPRHLLRSDVPQWGRAVVILADVQPPPLPDEPFHIALH